MGLRLRTGPFVTHLRTNIPEVAEAVHFLYGDFSVEADDGFADFHVQLLAPGGIRRWWRPQARCLADGRDLFLPLPRSVAVPLLEWGLNRCIARRCHQYLLIHAAVIERGGRAAVLAGLPGSGKSTLCAALVHRGWRFLSDEFALVRPAEGDLVPLARPIGLKDAAIGVIRRFVPGVPIGPVAGNVHGGTIAHVRPPADSVARAAETARPAWVVFPTYRAGAATELRRVSRARGLLGLARNSFNHSVLGARGFELLADLVDGSACYEFSYHDLDEAVRVFATLPVP